MKKIKIAHLYYDLLNLYGENGNTRVLASAFEKQGLKCEVHFLSIEDKIDFNDYDIFYIGTGSEENELIVLENMMKYKNAIKKAINDNKFFIVTGNAIELFGKNIITLDKKEIKCLDIFPYTCQIVDFRIIGEQVYKTDLLDSKIIGFQNRQTIMENCSNNLFKVITGTGYAPKVEFEGIHTNNFYGTYLLGPLLVRNPYFLDLIVKKVLEDKKIEYKIVEEDIMYKAYHEYLKNFVNE